MTSFSYAFSYFFISDIDECAKDIDSCDQICTNTPGSYNCSCQKGFKLSRDALNCQGNPVLFILVTIIHACWKKKKKTCNRSKNVSYLNPGIYYVKTIFRKAPPFFTRISCRSNDYGLQRRYNVKMIWRVM